MADMLNVAVSGLKAFQRALDTTSHNIANAATPGYSRQRVELSTSQPQTLGTSNIGTGVQVDSVNRYSDALLINQVRTSSSANSRLTTYSTKADGLNNLFGDSATGLSAALQKFTNAIQGVANTPNSPSARQVMLGEAQNLTERLKSYDRQLDQMDADINSSLKAEASSITTAAQNIAQLNQQIVVAQSSTGSPPNDLLDARDKAIDDLATHVGVSVVPQGDGSVNVFIGNGQSLVTGTVAGTVIAQQDAYDPSRYTLAYQTPGGAVDLKSVLSGGTVGGLFDFRREMLDPARNQLGQMAVGLTSAINAQSRQGMDLSGNLGGDLLGVGKVQVLASKFNDGNATVAVTRTSAGALTANDYVMQYTGGAWALRRSDTGVAVPMTGTGTSADPFIADGLAIVVGNTPANGDSFLVQPTSAAVEGLSVLITDPAKIAAAAPIRTAVGATNTGSATISAGEVLDASTPATLTAPVTLQFTDATHYSVNGTGSFLFTPGANIDANGWRVQINGAPATGDTFTVGSNAGGVGDNRNALALAGITAKGVLSGGSESIEQATTRFVGQIGVSAGQAQSSLDAQGIIYNDAVSQRDAVSGVNLDEEAANLLRYQQAYQAAAQVIKITQDLFASLLAATGR